MDSKIEFTFYYLSQWPDTRVHQPIVMTVGGMPEVIVSITKKNSAMVSVALSVRGTAITFPDLGVDLSSSRFRLSIEGKSDGVVVASLFVDDVLIDRQRQPADTGALPGNTITLAGSAIVSDYKVYKRG